MTYTGIQCFSRVLCTNIFKDFVRMLRPPPWILRSRNLEQRSCLSNPNFKKNVLKSKVLEYTGYLKWKFFENCAFTLFSLQRRKDLNRKMHGQAGLRPNMKILKHQQSVSASELSKDPAARPLMPATRTPMATTNLAAAHSRELTSGRPSTKPCSKWPQRIRRRLRQRRPLQPLHLPLKTKLQPRRKTRPPRK